MTTYIAWDGNEYPLPVPDGWYLGADDRWWPEGHGPGPAAVASPPPADLPSAAPPPGMPSAAPPAETPETVYSAPPPGQTSSPEPFSASTSPSSGGGNGKPALIVGLVVVGIAAVAAGAFFALGSGDEDDEAAPATTVFQTELGEETEGEQAPAENGGDQNESTEPADVPASGPGTIDDPIPIGETFEVRYEDFDSGEERVWNIVVLEPLSNITDAVAEENQFNDPPPAGLQFMGAPIRVTYVSGPAPASLFELTFKAIGPSGVVLTTFDPGCGVVPDSLDTFTELFAGGSVEGNVCWPAGEADQADLTMIVEVFFDEATVYADLTG